MVAIGLLREGKIPVDNRVALTPKQCRWVEDHLPCKIRVQSSANRCFRDKEYMEAGIEITEDISSCDILLGIKEVPVSSLIPGKTYLFFSHTKKLQPYNQLLLQEIIKREITLIDYECLEHEDGTRIIGFGFFAGVVGAHNAIMAYGARTGAFHLGRVYQQKSFQQLIHTYFGLKLPNLKIAVTGSGRVAHGIVEIMNLLEIHEVDPEDFLSGNFTYPVFVSLKGQELYRHRDTRTYNRRDFHEHPEDYHCLFKKYLPVTDILINGVYWDLRIDRLFEMDDLKRPDFAIKTISDISDDRNGSVPCNLADSTIENPVYGVSKKTGQLIQPYQEGSVDIIAIGNLPNELPRDASRYFGEQMIKFVLNDLLSGGSETLGNATMVRNGELTEKYSYLKEYAGL
ncbi:MAG: alanine dehydrogenase [Bacteroidota bacterium]|nr:alanine dehydrogenase [Bacteroidota bacterium]